jgi:hypothetical protein
MDAPFIQWYRPTDLANPVTTHNFGIVDAESTSTEAEFQIWNNKGGTVAKSDATNVFITTKDLSGVDGDPVATRKHAVLEVSRFDGSSFLAYGEVAGSTTTLPVINAAGTSGIIKGDINDGNPDTVNSKDNYARVKLRLKVFLSAPAGTMSWKTRVSYQYTG